MTDFSNVANALTEEAAASADKSGAPPVIYNHALFKRVYQLQESSSTAGTDITALQSDVTTLQAETASLLPVGQIRVPLALAANSTWATYAIAPIYGATITSLQLITPTAFASTLGTVTLTVKKTSSAGNTMLSAATLDLETVPANALVALAVTATSADLVLGGSGPVYVAVTSNNADATGPAGAAACLVINFTYTLD